jgi:hypothetical protein
MHLHGVKSCGKSVSRGSRILLDDAGNFCGFKSAWRWDRLKALCREGLPIGFDGRRRDG